MSIQVDGREGGVSKMIQGAWKENTGASVYILLPVGKKEIELCEHLVCFDNSSCVCMFSHSLRPCGL